MRIGVFISLLFFIIIDATYALTVTCKRYECLYKGKCYRKGWRHAWKDVDNEHGIEMTLKCTRRKRNLVIVSAVCDYEGTKVKNTDGWKKFGNPSCLEVRCRKGKLSVHKMLRYTGCPVDGECVARGATWNETTTSFIKTNKCVLRKRRSKREIKTISAYCLVDGNYIRYGKTYTDESNCVKYKCKWQRKLRYIKTIPKKTGCLYKGECKPRGLWNDTSHADFIFTHRCRFNRTNSYTFPVSSYCRTNDGTFVANGEQWDDIDTCQRKTCSFDKQTKTVSVQQESLGCNVAGHGCIINGETGNMDINGTPYIVRCNDFKAEVV